MEEEEISLLSDTTAQETEMAESPINQEDFFVWIGNLSSSLYSSLYSSLSDSNINQKSTFQRAFRISISKKSC
jgi:hypothetical protein